jgi:NADP-dependent 3-hydroxy acid dehydrogenase YdfG
MNKLLLFFICVFSLLQAEQKVVLISGATGGIGAETVKAFSQKGWTVWAGYRKNIPDSILELPNVSFIPLDVTNDEDVLSAVSEIIKSEGHIDVLINNAGYAIFGLDEEVNKKEIEKMFDVNFYGSLRLIKAVLPHMRLAGKGHIINVSSTSGIRAVPGLGLYAATKFALEAISESLAATLYPTIQVSIVEPGTVKNDFVNNAQAFENPFIKALINKLLLLAQSGQECSEIGQLMVAIAENPQPNLRYQTSTKVEETAAKKFVDITGNKLRDEWRLFYQQLNQ